MCLLVRRILEQMDDNEKAAGIAEGAAAKKRKKGKARRSKTKKQPRAEHRPYPRATLEQAITVAKAIKEKNGGNPWPASEIAAVLGVSPKTAAFRYQLFAARRFGLTEGTDSNGQVSLSELGKKLVYSGSPEEELGAKREAFLNVEIFKNVLEHYHGGKLPEMQYLGNTLQSKFKLPAVHHEEFSTLFKQNSKYAGLDPGDAGSSHGEQKSGQESTSSIIVLGEPKKKTGLVCFVIMPFVEKSGMYSAGFFDEVLNSLIIPAGRDAGFEVKTAIRQGTEMIHSTIVNEILDADMCICDLTEHNPNVLFELGMRLGHDKPVALIQAEGTARVFDVDNVLRVLPYKKELWRTTVTKDLPDLTAHIKATWDNRHTAESYYKLLRREKAGEASKSATA